MRASNTVVLLLLAACGDDLPGPDANIVPNDDLRGLVTVEYRSDRNPPGDLRVFFQNVDSSLVLATRTQSDGTANTFMAPGGFVTLIDANDIWTWAGVQPGDHLVLDRRLFNGGVPQITINLGAPVDPGAAVYQMTSPCMPAPFNFTSVPGPIPVAVPLCTGKVTDMLVLSFSPGPLDAPTGFLYRPDVQIEESALATFTGPYQRPRASTVTAANVPAASTLFTVTQQLGEDLVVYLQRGSVSVGNWTSSLAMPVAPGMKLVTKLDEQPEFGRLSSFHTTDWGEFTGDRVIDVGASALPRIVARPTFDAQTREARWSEGPEGALPTGALAQIQFNSPQIIGLYVWRMIAPRGATPTIGFPLLPDPELDPQLGDSPDVFSLYSISATGGYDAIRSQVLGRFPTQDWPTAEPTGHVAYEALE
jgi:hypothetical protein